MKRAALVIVLLILIAAVVIGWVLMRHKEASVAAVLPADTMLLARVPDGWSTAQKYEKSKLRTILESDEVGFTLGMVMGLAEGQAGVDFNEMMERLDKVMESFWQNLSGEAFIAVFDLDIQNMEQNGLIAGLRPYPGTASMPTFIDRVREDLGPVLEGRPTGTAEYEGVAYEWVEISPGIRVCQGDVSSWIITAVGEAAFQRFVDATTEDGPKLVDNAEYQAVVAELDGPMDAEFFFNFLPLKDKLLDQLAAVPGMDEDLGMLKEAYRPVTAFGAGMRFTDDGDIEDIWVSLMPKADRPDLGATFEPCAYETLKFTDAHTLIYFAQNIDWKRYWDYLVKLYGHSPDLIQALNMAESAFKSMQLDLHENLLNALGPEVAFQLDWPADSLAPDGALYLQVNDWDAFQPVIERIMEATSEQTSNQLGATEPVGQWVASSLPGGIEVQSFTMPTSPYAPTLITQGPVFGIFLSKDSAERILTGEGKTPITGQPAFTSLGLSLDGTSSLTFVDMGSLVNRIYGIAKEYAAMAALYSPELAAMVDPSALPQELAVTGPLGAWAMIAYVTEDAGVARSVSAIGNPIVPTALLMGVSAPMLEDFSNAIAPQPDPAALEAMDPASADGVRAELDELRAVIDAWAADQNAAAGTPVKWEALEGYFIPGSRLEEAAGTDALGNPYVLGVVGEKPADVAPETKNAFPDRDDSFWAPQVTPAPAMPDGTEVEETEVEAVIEPS